MVELSLTKRQQEIFDFIKHYSGQHGYPPTVRDIGKAIGLTSSSTVHAHLANLEKLGVLRRDPTKPRAMEILDKAKKAIVPQGLPLVGRVAAGQPLLAEENIEDYVEIPQIAGGDEGEYVLKVQGDSMKNVASWRATTSWYRARTRRRTARSSLLCSMTRPPSSASTRKPTMSGSSPRTRP